MTPESFAFIAGLAKGRSGLVLTADQGYMLETRLGPLLKREGLASLDALALRLKDPRAAPLAEAVTEALTTNESSFFRDGKPFEHLRRALPALAAARAPGVPLRIWSAACSTGQEAYSIAMILAELAATMGGRRAEIIGTDIAQEVLARARDGSFTQFEVQRGLPARLLVKHFRQEAILQVTRIESNPAQSHVLTIVGRQHEHRRKQIARAIGTFSFGRTETDVVRPLAQLVH